VIGGSRLEAGQEQLPGLAYARVLTDEEAHLFSGRGVTDPNTGAVIGPVYICDECITLCAASLAQDRRTPP
jgi:hypothetical protein